MRRVIRWFWIPLALVFLFEAWLWDHLEPIVGWIVDRLPLQHLKDRIAHWVSRLSPASSLIVFVVPVGLLLPFKLAGLWLLARGYWMGAAGTLFFAKVVGLGSTAFVFDVTRPKLLQLDLVPPPLRHGHGVARLGARAGRSDQGAHQGAHRRCLRRTGPAARCGCCCASAGACAHRSIGAKLERLGGGRGRNRLGSDAGARRTARTGRCR